MKIKGAPAGNGPLEVHAWREADLLRPGATPRTGAQRQAACDARKRARGLKEYRNLWGRPEYEKTVREYVRAINGEWQIVALKHLEAGYYVGAIKHCRAVTGMGLKEAKDAVDLLRAKGEA